MRKRTPSPMLLAALSAGAPAALAQTFEFPVPSGDRWHYPFNFTPGTRPLASVFGAAGLDGFNDRDGEFYLYWDTAATIPSGQDPDSYDVAAVQVTVTHYIDPNPENRPTWPIDLSPDEWYTFDLNGDGEINADGIPRGQPGDSDGESDDADPGRAIELTGLGFGPFYEYPEFVETSLFIGSNFDNESARDPFPFVYQAGSGALLHIEDNVKGYWNDAAGVTSFTPQPWSVGVPIGYTPGGQTVPFDIEFDVDLSLSAGLVRQYFQEQLSGGRVYVNVTSLADTVMFGAPSDYPVLFTKEGLGLDPNAKAAKLTIVLDTGPEGDLNGDGCVDLADLSILLLHFGGSGGADEGDLDGDGQVNLTDLSRLLIHFGSC